MMNNIMNPEEVSSSMYLYGEEAVDFNLPIETQKLFLHERERRVEEVIAEIQSHHIQDRDEARMRECMKTRKWVNKMYAELGGK